MSNANRPHNPAVSRATTPTEGRPELIRRSDLAGSPEARQFIGAEHGGLPMSLFLVDERPSAGPRLHRHPYPELFIVHAGQADFEIDGARLSATVGDILIAPAQTAHRFTNTGDDRLRVTAIHASPVMDTQWLEPAQPRTERPC